MSEDRTRRGPLSFFGNMKTAQKLLAGFLAVSVLMVAVGILGITKLAAAQDALQGMYTDSLQAIAWLGETEAMTRAVRLDVTNLLVAQSETDMAAIKVTMGEDDAAVDKNWAAYTATDMTGREKLRDDFKAALAAYRQMRDTQQIDIAVAKDLVAFDKVRTTVAKPITDRMTADLAGLQDIETKAADQSLKGAQAAYQSARTLIIALVAAAVVLSIVLSVAIGRMIAGPLRKTVNVLEGLAEGRLDMHLDVDTKDEVGQMASALNSALVKLRAAITAMGSNAQGLASSSEELSAVSAQMKGSAEESATQAGVVSAAAEQVSTNVQTVATGTEEMSASIREIAKNTNEASSVAAQAVHVAQSAGATVAKLGESSAEIGDVIKVISQIAEQTNLLALNATIEAARAGESGKGFAVVASEVKELARETSKATEDIGSRIEAIQNDTKAAVAAISQISGIIAQINDSQSTIASAVEEQTATTNEMARNVSEAATGSTDIASNITGVARTAVDTQAAAGSTAEAASELARMASDLQQLVGQFSC